MMTYLVIGLCLFLLVIVVYISAKPISMGIEARRKINDNLEINDESDQTISDYNDEYKISKNSISDEISKLSDLKNKGLLTEEEYEKAKNKLLD